ncbi:prepilin-type N-terminal cleavage/methylation domain-containing protein [Rodentibacter caecimuris]|uniref:Prepilin-type N-terminal cleavage/methylation domain-containing protein n=1 Tax=Rodentibacter caecimuris TaxID=1796644 RepID=A0A9X8VZT1_9PAST|nr:MULTISPECIES: type II secretion system protein [Pasteurellaceae]AOF52260.1 Type II secretory pathway, pseudopilin PulG [Pasteurellaceae bacterium NI1060]MCQ9122530.1 type II secretion system GspH family protein [Rodentibacter heylii]MCR1836410.1 type II secretion system GspH family protein [Pasteurella caecimuris]MCU0105839.1 type II secretion system GspH family protein [Pasteurella caecimuris]MCX2962029.1 type II secretion system GspH family protein [Rodentibacter heylii]
MHKGLTLVELLIGLAIISIALSFSLPLWQTDNPKTILAKEQHRLYLFLRQIQGRAENSSEIWFILANRHPTTKQWCMTAQVKNDKRCDCFAPTSCPKEVYAHFYYPYFDQKTMIISPKIYPTEMARFNGIRNTIDSNCFLLQAGDESTLFSFFNVGSLKLKPNQSASACTR